MIESHCSRFFVVLERLVTREVFAYNKDRREGAKKLLFHIRGSKILHYDIACVFLEFAFECADGRCFFVCRDLFYQSFRARSDGVSPFLHRAFCKCGEREHIGSDTVMVSTAQRIHHNKRIIDGITTRYPYRIIGGHLCRTQASARACVVGHASCCMWYHSYRNS